MPSQSKRNRVFVDWPVQGALIRRLILHWIVTGFAAFIFLFILHVFNSRDPLSLSAYAAGLWDKYGLLAVVFVTLFPVFAYDTIRLSHRFAGPMVVVRKSLAELARGETVAPLQFRRNDFWKEIAANVNTIADRLNQSDSSVAVQHESTETGDEPVVTLTSG